MTHKVKVIKKVLKEGGPFTRADILIGDFFHYTDSSEFDQVPRFMLNNGEYGHLDSGHSDGSNQAYRPVEILGKGSQIVIEVG